VQLPSGAIPWYPGGPLDPWNHVEAAMGLDVAGRHAEAEAAYRWLARTQNPDGSWYAEYHLPCVTNAAKDANFTAYIAVGVLHHALICDSSFPALMWPTVRRAMDFVLRLRTRNGAVRWRMLADGSESDQVLLTGCASIHQALLCAGAVADQLGQPRPDWIAAAEDLRHVFHTRPEVFAPKPHAMDWYYPVLGSMLDAPESSARLAADWHRFVVPELGVRCVADQPWVTGGETAELALTLALQSDFRARGLLSDISRLRHTDGSYWTGYQYANKVIWPRERTTWTAGAILLATAAVNGEAATHAVFSPPRDVRFAES
jgi:hypothetical protein